MDTETEYLVECDSDGLVISIGQSSLTVLRSPSITVRAIMAGHGPAYSSRGSQIVNVPKLRFAQRFVPKALGATMWFWIFYRLREDGPVLFGFRKPWEGHH